MPSGARRSPGLVPVFHCTLAGGFRSHRVVSQAHARFRWGARAESFQGLPELPIHPSCPISDSQGLCRMGILRVKMTGNI